MSINFKGYAACPLKNLHLQIPTFDEQNKRVLKAANELKDIADKENFGLVLHAGGDLYTEEQAQALSPGFLNNKKRLPNRAFVQDLRIFLPNNKLGIFKNQRKKNFAGSEILESGKFAKALNKETQDLSVLTQGGNFFIGKKDNGENYILIGDEPIRKICGGSNTNWYNADFEKRKGLAKEAFEKISKETGIKTENIYMVSQSFVLPPQKEDSLPPGFHIDFHIDMVLRPLKYPYVLVNDPGLVAKETSDADNLIGFRQLNHVKLNRLAPAEKLIEELEKQGFKPIPVPGIFIESRGNYMNAIVHERPDGKLVYITNSDSETNKDKGINLDKIFKDFIEKNVPCIKKVVFVKNHLLDYFGGIHCMTLEEPDFNKWV